jgi:hypothetical protein
MILISIFFLGIAIVILIDIIRIAGNIKKIDYATNVLKKVYYFHDNDLITPVQARVFLNDLDNPLDFQSVYEVDMELNRIRDEAKSSNR